MRQIRSVENRFRRALEGSYTPADGQPSAAALMRTELCLYLLVGVAEGQAAAGVPALLDGYRALWDAVEDVPTDAAVRLANARTILWPSRRSYGWDRELRAYLDVPEEVRGFRLDELGRPVRRECRIALQRWDWYEELLTAPLPFAAAQARYADPGRYRMASTARGVGIDIPEDLPPPQPPVRHDGTVRAREAIEVEWSALVETARWMEEADASAGRPESRWAERLQDIIVQVRQDDDTFGVTTALRIDRMLHLVGMVSVGKTTLVMILAVWMARHGHQVTIVVGDNSAALRAAHELSAYEGVTAAPIMGQNRTRHAERLHRLQPPAPGRLLPRSPYGFDLVSTACGLDGLRDTATPLAVREAPCQDLIPADGDEPVDGWRSGTRRTCPLWHRCQRHEAARRLVTANVWIATPWSLVHTRVPAPLSDGQLRYLEAAWRRSDLILVDEADQVQANLDSMFANSQVLLGPSDEAWIDEIGTRVSDRLRAAGRAQVRSRQIRRFTLALNNARTAADVIYQLLHRDRVRPGQPVLSWLDPDYFTAWSLFDGLAQDWAGLAGSKAAGWDDDPLYQALRQQFNAFIDAPTDIAEDGVARGLADLTERLLSDTDEDVREGDVRSWLTDLAGSELVEGTKVAPSDLDRNVWRLEFAIAVAVMAHRLNLMLAMWPEVAAELELFETLPTEVRRPPVDLAVAVPESPMGNVLGFQYVGDEASRRVGQLGEFRFFRYTGVGRALLVNMPNLFPADGPGPNVVLLSGTSWAGTSPRYHIDVPVGAILCPTVEKLAEIERTTFALDIQHTGERSTPIWVSGRYGAERTAALRQMVAALTKPGAGPRQPNRLERERAALPLDRQKIMLLVGSYAEARAVTAELLRQKSSWTGQVRCLIGDDEQETGWDDTHLLRRGDVADFGTDDAWLLVAPILAVERGHNILNTEGIAAIGAAFFLVRPHPRPKDLSYVTQRINQYALEQLAPTPIGDGPDHERLATAGRLRRRAAQREWRRLLHALVAYSQLGTSERNRVAWTQLVTIWQVVGRLLRGGQAAKIYFCDAAFAPNTARRGEDAADLDDASTSLLHGMREVLSPYFEAGSAHPDRHLVQALYQPLYQALSAMGDH
ncbi:transposase [Actinoplanes sp. NPDC051470]|uniref:pPIWI_RE_Z domain-containing protein n=1 Tax=Actinoplanes sp. NPDC051470 TaxID=3157224 RepID=UPI0034139E5C